MTLRLECSKRNYELEHLKHKVKGKRIQIRENPLAGLEDYQEGDEEVFENENLGNKADQEAAAATITHQLGQKDPLADFHKLEVMLLNRQGFETWDAKKLSIFATFQSQTDG